MEPALRCGSRPRTRVQNGRLHQHDYMPEPLSITVNAKLSRSATSTSLRCAAHEYRAMAAGHCHLLFYNRLMPWYYAASWLLHHEVGG